MQDTDEGSPAEGIQKANKHMTAHIAHAHLQKHEHPLIPIREGVATTQPAGLQSYKATWLKG